MHYATRTLNIIFTGDKSARVCDPRNGPLQMKDTDELNSTAIDGSHLANGFCIFDSGLEIGDLD